MSLSEFFFPELAISPFFSILDEPIYHSYYHQPRRLQNYHHRDRHSSALLRRTPSLLADPFFNARALRRRMQRLRTPAVEINEDEEERSYLVEAELPGVKREDVDLRIGEEGRKLTIEGKVVRRVGKGKLEKDQVDEKMDEDATGPVEETAALEDNTSTPSPTTDDTTTNQPTTPSTDQQPPQQQVTTRPTSDEQLIESDDFVGTTSTTFSRTVWLSDPVDPRNVEAKLEDGILKLRIPKLAMPMQETRVEVL